MPGFNSIHEMRSALTDQRYLMDDGLATVVFLALRLRKPLLVEGEPGVGKTELAKALAAATGTPLIRLSAAAPAAARGRPHAPVLRGVPAAPAAAGGPGAPRCGAADR
jgi:hypothetical protein